MKNQRIRCSAIIFFLILSITVLPITQSVSNAQGNEAGSSTAEGATPVPAAGAAGTGGASSISTLAKIGIAAASLGVVLILISSIDSSSTTTSH
jgi:hypothetical protein